MVSAISERVRDEIRRKINSYGVAHWILCCENPIEQYEFIVTKETHYALVDSLGAKWNEKTRLFENVPPGIHYQEVKQLVTEAFKSSLEHWGNLRQAHLLIHTLGIE